MKLQLKANALTHLTDARYFASMEVDWLGFNLDSTDQNASDPLFVKSIREWVSGPTFIGEFNFSSVKEILSVSENLGLNAIQLGPLFNFNDLKFIPDDYTVFAEIMVDVDIPSPDIQAFLNQYNNKVNFYILNFSNLFKPLSVQWKNALVNLCKVFPIFIHSNGNVNQIIDHILYFKPAGYCLSGGSEEKTGIKSFEEIDEIFEQLTALDFK